MNKPHGEIIWIVYGLESTWGKNDGCKNSGKVNGWGYAQNTRVWNCYDTVDEVTDYVSEWFTKHLQDKTLAQALCYYQSGYATDTCTYYQNYLKLKNS